VLNSNIGPWPYTDIRLGWKSLPATNSGLLRKFVNYSRKRFYNIGPSLVKVPLIGSEVKTKFPSSSLKASSKKVLLEPEGRTSLPINKH
jgi:hypothetical protein